MKMKNSMFRILALFLFGVVCQNSMRSQDFWGFREIEGVHYETSQAWEEPIWLNVIEDSSHKNLTDVTLPEDIVIETPWETRHAVIEKIDDLCFSRSKIKSIVLPSSVRRIGKWAFAHSALQTISLPEGLLYIGEGAFAYTGISKIIVPESVKLIDFEAFLWCSYLEEVDLPSTLQSLGGFVFRFCNGVRDIYSRAVTPPDASDSDFGVIHYPYEPLEECWPGPILHECVLHVPAESVELYRNAPGWCNFLNIVPIDEEDGVEEVMSETSEAPFIISDHTVTIRCSANDKVSIYDVNGILLESHHPEADTEVIHRGEGVRVISINGSTYKIQL